VGNLAAIPYTAAGFLTAYPTGTNPATSTLNFNAGQVRANNFQLGLSGNGQLTIAATTSVDAIVDLVGYFAHDPPTWTMTLRDEANRLATEYTVPQPGGGSITRVKSYLYLGNLLAATRNSTGGYTYYASDHLGTPRATTGVLTETHKWSAPHLGEAAYRYTSLRSATRTTSTSNSASATEYTTRYRPTRTRYRLLSPASFSHPTGRGSLASARMRVTMRCRSFFRSTASISPAADGLIRTL
jgi:hypothetical protein